MRPSWLIPNNTTTVSWKTKLASARADGPADATCCQLPPLGTSEMTPHVSPVIRLVGVMAR
jgi:hypothetical protein